MRPELRASYEVRDPVIRAAVDPALMEHRDAMYRDHLELPIDLGESRGFDRWSAPSPVDRFLLQSTQ
jgi:hypothetical protein